MSLETGKIYDGKVRNIAPYGAFVEITVDGKVQVGMVHISEIANTYVNEIKDHLTEGQDVKVKVLNIDENGKVSLSIKKAVDTPPQQQKRRPQQQSRQSNQGNQGQPPVITSKQQPVETSFEDMLSRFKQSSEEKMSDLKRNIDSKRRSSGRRGK